jgi:NitT/TauT family transport system substrate-binding protein
MISRTLAAIVVLLALTAAAPAQERVTVGTQRLATSGVLFFAVGKGYFQAEGLQVELKIYPSAPAAVNALAAGELDLAAADFTATAFNLAGKGAIKIVAGQAQENRDFEGTDIVVTPDAFSRGLRKLGDLAGYSVAIADLGSSYHYQLGQIARIKKFDLKNVTLMPLHSLEAVAAVLSNGQVDAAILPAQYARDLLVAGQARLLGWYSEIDEQQLGALFASAKAIAARRATVEKFIRGYQRGAADYAAALLRRDRYAKRVSDTTSQAAATLIGRYLYPSYPADRAMLTMETSAYYTDRQARYDAADIARQIAWFKSQGLVEASVDPAAVIDASFIATR